jgi:CubicO group peptidase (beta-lactamase class C family)
MEKWKKRTVELISALAIENKKMPAVVPYKPQKLFVSGGEMKYFKRQAPSRVGVRAAVLSDMLADLEAQTNANVHSLVVIKDGAVICEVSAPGYDVNCAHLSHSMSKTMTMLAVGILSDEGRLNVKSRVVDIFPEIPYADARFADMTVEDLLVMKSGVPFAEIGTVTEDKWTDAFFASELSAAPGEKFAYNSMNSYILSRIVTKITGLSLTEYLRPRLLDPLSIDNFFWEESSEGVSKGGFGIYMSTESWAKIGYLLLEGGVFEGEQILSERWIARAIRAYSRTPDDTGEFNYGYHIWVSKRGEDFLLNGMFGQNVWVCPRNNIVVAMTSGNNELFSNSPALDIVRRHLSGDISGRSGFADVKELRERSDNFFRQRCAVRPEPARRGLAYTLGIKNPRPFVSAWSSVLGTYAFGDNNTGILPLFVRVMQNNYQGGIKNFTLSRDGDKLYFTSFEGSETYRLEVGLYEYKKNIVTFQGEPYIVNALGEAFMDGADAMIYRISLVFPELPNTRIINLRLDSDGKHLYASLGETPNERIAERYISMMAGEGRFAFLLGMLIRKISEQFLDDKLFNLFNPSLVGINTNVPGWDKQIRAESEAARSEREASTKFLLSLIARFTADEPPVSAEPEKDLQATDKKGIFDKIKSFILRKRGDEPGDADVTIAEVLEEIADDARATENVPEAEETAPVAEEAVPDAEDGEFAEQMAIDLGIPGVEEGEELVLEPEDDEALEQMTFDIPEE